ncbi:hypothetical protein N7540_005869 [Penicillium herquei]|nr:hypothetical protein N7540_005869 [Penicillium herquei]
MILGRSGMAILVTLGQILLLSDILQCTHGHRIVPDRIVRKNTSSAIDRRDGSDAGDSDWVAVTGWPTFSLDPITCGSSTVESEAEAMDMAKRESAVTDTTNTMFAEILYSVLEINRGALASIATLESAWDTMNSKGKLSSEEKTQINFYMAMYGSFKATDSTGMERASDRIAQLKSFTNEYVEGLDNDSFNVRIICDVSAWEATDADADDEGWLLEDERSLFLIEKKSSEQSNVCEDSNGDDSFAFMMDTGFGYDYMTICPKGWTNFAEATAIPEQKAKSISDLEFQDMDDVAKKPVDGVFVHELTHADDFWGGKALDDIELADGRVAYGFENIADLANEGNSEDDATQLKALKNADTYKYWAVAF